MAEIIRSYSYDDNGDPVMILRKKRQALTTFQLEKRKPISFAIRLQDIWQYSEEHNPAFRQHMLFVCGKIHDLFDLGLVTISKLSQIAGIIQTGIDDLVKMKPKHEQRITVGEVKTTVSSLRGDGYQVFENDLVISI